MIDDESTTNHVQMERQPRKRVRGIHQLTPHMFDHLSSAPLAIIDQITFGLLNPAHLVAISACEVTEFTLYKKQLPARNSPNDTTMGPSDNQTQCGTCDEPIATCQGHMGHIVLEAPCYTNSWIKATCQALAAVCFHCSKLLINRKSAKFRNIARVTNEKERLAALAEVGKKSKRCGIYTQSQMRALKAEEALEAEEKNKATAAAEENVTAATKKKPSRSRKKVKIAQDSTVPVKKKKTVDMLNDESACGCHGEQYDFWEDGIRVWYCQKPQTSARSRAKATQASSTVDGENKEPATAAAVLPEYEPLSAWTARNILQHISDVDAQLLGFDPVHSRPEWMIWTHFPVPPPPVRPPVTSVHGSKSRGEDDTTKKIKDVVKANRTLKQFKAAVMELKALGGDVSKLSNSNSATARALGLKAKAAATSNGGTVTVNDTLLIKSLGKRGRATHAASDKEQIEEEPSSPTRKKKKSQQDDDEDDSEDEEKQRKRKAVVDASVKELQQQKRKKKKLLQTAKPPPDLQFAYRQEGDKTNIVVTHRASETEELQRLLIPAEQEVVDWAQEEGTKEAVRQLQENVALWFRSDLPVKLPGQRSHGNSKTIHDRYKGKFGRIRSNLLGKRVDFCARGVITPDPSLDVDQLGTPECVAVHLTTPEVVQFSNIKDLTKMVRNGPEVWPGARSIIKPDGTTLDLRYEDRYAIVLQYGWTVERHIQDNDHGVFNRQPSLHRMSMMSHRMKIMPGYTFRLNLSVCKAYNADFDGDAMVLHIVQMLRAIMETETLMYVNNQIVSPQNCKPIIAEVQDPVLGTWIVTGKDFLLSADDFMRYLGQAKHTTAWKIPPPALWQLNRRTLEWQSYYTGKQLFSALLPKEFYMSYMPRQFEPHSNVLFQIPKKSLSELEQEQAALRAQWKEAAADQHPNAPEVIAMKERKEQLDQERKALDDNQLRKWLRDEMIVIMNGQLLHGRIDSSMIGSAANSIVHRMIHEFNNNLTSEFLSDLQRVINMALMDIGVSVGISDCVSPCETQVQRLLNTALPDIQQHPLLQKQREDTQLVRAVKEQTTCNLLQDLRKTVAGLIQAALGQEQYLQQRNRLMKMVKAGSKGNVINIAQILGCLGQIIVEGKRPGDEARGRILPHFEKHKSDLRASGFVRNNFSKSLDPVEYYMHALGGREGLVNTSVTTSETGYTSRKLVKSMESTGVKQDMTVRDSGNNIVEMAYGGDGFDAMCLLRLPLPTMSMDDDKLREVYGAVQALAQAEVWPVGSKIREVVERNVMHAPAVLKPTTKKRRTTTIVSESVQAASSPEFETERLALQLEFSYLQQDRDRQREQQLVHPGETCQNEIMVPVDVAAIIEKESMLQQRDSKQAAIATTNKYLMPSELLVTVSALIGSLYKHYPSYHNELPHFEALIRCHLSTRNVLLRYQLTRQTLAKVLFQIERRFVRALVSPGEMVGVVAAQSLGELLTQTSLNVFHTAGVGSQLSGQINSLQGYINLGRTPTNPSMTIYLNPQAHLFMPSTWNAPVKPETAQQQVADYLQKQLVAQYLDDFLLDDQSAQVLYEPTPKTDTGGGGGKDAAWLTPYFDTVMDEELNEFSPYCIRYTIDIAKLQDKQVPWEMLLERLQAFWNEKQGMCLFVHSPIDRHSTSIVLRIYVSTQSRNYEQFASNKDIGTNQQKLMECLCQHMKRKVAISGLDGITGSSLAQQKQTKINAATGELYEVTEWCIITIGSNLLETLGLPWVDTARSTTNHIREICEVFGIFAAGNALQRGITLNLTMNSSSVERRHIGLLVRTMVHRGYIVPLRRHGMNQLRDAGALQKSSFEESIPILNDAALKGETDPMAGTTENLMAGNTPPLGTGTVDAKLNPVRCSREVMEQNERNLHEAVLGEVTSMDLAVMIYNTGQEHCAHFDKKKQAGATVDEVDNEYCGSDMQALLYPMSVNENVVVSQRALPVRVATAVKPTKKRKRKASQAATTDDDDGNGEMNEEPVNLRAQLTDDDFFAQLDQTRGASNERSKCSPKRPAAAKSRRDTQATKLQLKHSTQSAALTPTSANPPHQPVVDKQSSEYQAAQFVYLPYYHHTL